MRTTASIDDVVKVINADHRDPFSVLGAHKVDVQGHQCVAIRAFRPDASELEIVDLRDGNCHPMAMIHESGFCEAVFLDCPEIFPYRLRTHFKAGTIVELHDPYSFLPVMSDFDRHLFGEGNNYYVFDKLGAHPMVINGISGVYFSVWAPDARRVSVIGDFNRWDGRCHQMRILGTSAIWELFVPGLEEGDKYKFEIMTHEGFNLDKADPFAFMAEIRPKTASVVYDYNKYSWQDSKWMEKRAATNWMEEPMLIYEVHLGSWMRNVEDGNRWLTYREMADRLIPYVKSMGYSHVELLPVSEHPFDGSWGYQVTGYYAPTSRFGAPDDFKYLVDRFHQEGIGIILDWVPAHFPKDPHSLGRFDGTCVYEHMDPRQGEHQDWGTLIFNYGRNEVRNFLLSNAMYWFDKFHIDGLRIDAVASMLYLDYSRKDGQWVPNQYGGRENLEAVSFLRQLNEMVYAYNKGAFTVAEESTAWPMVSRPLYIGGLGFGFKWNMGWMNDILAYFKEDPIYRKYHHNKLTFAIWYAFTENFHLSISHDEVVHGKGSLINKMPGDVEEKFANLRLFFAYMYAHPGKKLHFMGSEFAQWKEWNHDSELDWWLLQYEEHRNFHTFMKELNHFYRGENSLWENDFDSSGFEWIDFSDSDNSIVSFIRRGKGKRDWIVCVFNFTPITRYGYHVGVPIPCFYSEVFNSNSELYGGSNIGNMGGVWADDMSCHGHYHSIPVTIPGFSAVFLRPELPEEPEIVISEPVSELVSEPVTETVVPQLPELAGKKSEVGKSAGKIVTKTVKKPDEKTKKTSDAKASSPKKTSGPAVKKTVKPKSDSGKKPRGGK